MHMWNRDSWTWTVAFGAAIVGYLATVDTDPRFWAYKDWINFLMFFFAWLTGKMATSPQPGENDYKRTNTTHRGGLLDSWLLPLLLAGSMLAVSCGGTFKPPVVTPEDQTQVRQVATKALAGIEVAGVVVRDGRQLVSDLATAGVVSVEVRSQVNAAVIRANEIVQPIILQIAAATRAVSVQSLVAQAAAAFTEAAAVLERQSDPRVQTAGRFLRTAIGALAALVGGVQ
jgi:hypothetical protein